jgi:hypothetical protein
MRGETSFRAASELGGDSKHKKAPAAEAAQNRLMTDARCGTKFRDGRSSSQTRLGSPFNTVNDLSIALISGGQGAGSRACGYWFGSPLASLAICRQLNNSM